MSKNSALEFYPKSQKEWRDWLDLNHQKEDSVWVIFYKKKTNKPTMSWSQAVDHALCFGWIDSTKRSLDKERYIQYFTRRKPKSTWSKVNKDKVQVLLESNLIMPSGMIAIETAKTNGSWTILDDVENLVIPPDFQIVLDADSRLKKEYLQLSSSRKKSVLHRLNSAKRKETREKRIVELIDEIKQNK